MNKFFQFIFILFGIILVLNISANLDIRLEDLESKIDKITMFLNLEANTDKEIENE